MNFEVVLSGLIRATESRSATTHLSAMTAQHPLELLLACTDLERGAIDEAPLAYLASLPLEVVLNAIEETLDELSRMDDKLH